MGTHDPHALSFNAAALFTHLSTNLDCDLSEEIEWVFTFEHSDFEHLMSVAGPFGDALCDSMKVEADGIACEFDETPNVTDERGKQVESPPHLTLGIVAVMTEEQLAKLHNVFSRLANRHKITYAGVNSY